MFLGIMDSPVEVGHSRWGGKAKERSGMRLEGPARTSYLVGNGEPLKGAEQGSEGIDALERSPWQLSGWWIGMVGSTWDTNKAITVWVQEWNSKVLNPGWACDKEVEVSRAWSWPEEEAGGERQEPSETAQLFCTRWIRSALRQSWWRWDPDAWIDKSRAQVRSGPGLSSQVTCPWVEGKAKSWDLS